MKAPRRPHRQVYRVYSEEEFLGAVDLSGAAVTEEWAVHDGEEWAPNAGEGLVPSASEERPDAVDDERALDAGEEWAREAAEQWEQEAAARGKGRGALGRAAAVAALTGALAATAAVVVVRESRFVASPRGTAGPTASSRYPVSVRSVTADLSARFISSQPAGRAIHRHRSARRASWTPRPAVRRGGALVVARSVIPPAAPAAPETAAPAPPPATTPTEAVRREFGFERQAG